MSRQSISKWRTYQPNDCKSHHLSPMWVLMSLDLEMLFHGIQEGATQILRDGLRCFLVCAPEQCIEVIETISASSFINALRRFFAVRGPAKQIRSDCGTNCFGVSRELAMDRTSLDLENVNENLNPPHTSHMGGAWERMIGISHHFLDYMLTHNVLTTLMAEL